jgi:SAM-dependent methyltransferase
MSDNHTLALLFDVGEYIERANLSEYLRDGSKRVLFVGSNNYRFLFNIARNFPDTLFYGFDGRSNVVSGARALFEEEALQNVSYWTVDHFDHLEYRRVASQQFPFDVVIYLPAAISSKSIPEARASRNASCSNCYRFLKQGGILIMCGLMGNELDLERPLSAEWLTEHGSWGSTVRSLVEYLYLRAKRTACPNTGLEYKPFVMEEEWCRTILEGTLRMKYCHSNTWIPPWVSEQCAELGKTPLDTMHASGVVVVQKA